MWRGQGATGQGAPQGYSKPLSLLVRTAGWILKAAGVVVAAIGVSLLTAHWIWTVLALAAGFGLMIAGTTLSPSAGTGAFVARNLIEADPADAHYVRPPGGNLGDPFSGPESDRFIGR